MRFLLLAILVFAVSCSHSVKRNTVDESELSEIVQTKLNEARELIKQSKTKQAIAKLAELHDDKIIPVEKAVKYNLRGVIFFNSNEVEKSLLNFEIAEKYSPTDTQLYSQVELNMASAHYKLGQFNELQTRLNKVDKKQLTDLELKKYAQLALASAQKLGSDQQIVSSSVMLLQDTKTFNEIQSSPMYSTLKDAFKKLSEAQKIHLLEEFKDSKNLAIAYLAQLEVDSRTLAGDKEGAKDVVDWLKSEFSANPEVDKFVKDFETRLDNSSQISLADVGLVLPLTGEKAGFGQRALNGIQTGLKVLNLNENIKIHSKDGMDVAAQSAQAVSELIQEENVSFIIGGLFPESAKAEYLEAKKYGVLYISLSQINLPKEEKSLHLIEIQGSIESQVQTLLSDEMIKKFGSRLGVIYPENEGGKAYVDEIWRKSEPRNVRLTSLSSFAKNTHDYRDTAQLFLGLKYPRERAEELKIVDDVYSLERSSIRRVQTLPPVLDFDWVFLATYPHEATQLIPTLAYYDANRIKVIGGPSWVSNSLVKEQKNLGTLYFVGDDPKDLNQEMLNKFQGLYGKPASLIEILALDAIKVGAEVLVATNGAGSRDDFDSKIKSSGKLKGLTTEWNFDDGVWIKKMNAMTITHGEIVKLFEASAI